MGGDGKSPPIFLIHFYLKKYTRRNDTTKMQEEIKEQVVAIFDKPKACALCPCLIAFEQKAYCRLTGTNITEPYKAYTDIPDCPLIDYEEYMESMDIDNYK